MKGNKNREMGEESGKRWGMWGKEWEYGQMDEGARGGIINENRNNGLDMKGNEK